MLLTDTTLSRDGRAASQRRQDLAGVDPRGVVVAGDALLRAAGDGRCAPLDRYPDLFMSYMPTACPTVGVVIYGVQRASWPDPLTWTTNVIAAGGHPAESDVLRELSAELIPYAPGKTSLELVSGRPALWTLVRELEVFPDDDIRPDLEPVAVLETLTALAFAMLLHRGVTLSPASARALQAAATGEPPYLYALRTSGDRAGPMGPLSWSSESPPVTVDVWEAAPERLRWLRSHDAFRTADFAAVMTDLAARGFVDDGNQELHAAVLRRLVTEAAGVATASVTTLDSDHTAVAIAQRWAHTQPLYPLPAPQPVHSDAVTTRAIDLLVDALERRPAATEHVAVVSATALTCGSHRAVPDVLQRITAHIGPPQLRPAVDSDEAAVCVAREVALRLAEAPAPDLRSHLGLPRREPCSYRLPEDAADGAGWIAARDSVCSLLCPTWDGPVLLDELVLDGGEAFAAGVACILLTISAAALRLRLQTGAHPLIDPDAVAADLVKARVLEPGDDELFAALLRTAATWATGAVIFESPPTPPDTSRLLRVATVTTALTCGSFFVVSNLTDPRQAVDAAVALACDLSDGIA